jgi:hypothetical protein
LKFIAGIPAPQKITIDVSAVELDALSCVYPEAQVQWCFHVARAWVGKLRTVIKLGSSSENELLRKRMMSDLKSLMWDRSKPEFTLKLSSFINNPEYLHITEFMSYFKQYHFQNDAFTR